MRVILTLDEVTRLFREKYGMEGLNVEVEVNSSEPTEADIVFHKVMEYILASQKINAIKALRGATGVGLKEAKDLVEGGENILLTHIKSSRLDMNRFYEFC